MEQLKQALTQMVPFIRTVGIRIDDIQRGHSTATLPAAPAVQNHLGTAHAGAVYTLGESASGGVVLSIFADLFPGVYIALKSATVQHVKARPGDVIATATAAEDCDAIRARFDETGKADFDVKVVLVADDVTIAEVTYTWAARAPRS